MFSKIVAQTKTRSTQVGSVHARMLNTFSSLRGELRVESASNPKQDKRGVCSGQKTKCVFDNINVRSSGTCGRFACVRCLSYFSFGNFNRVVAGRAAETLPPTRRWRHPGLHVSGRHCGC